MRVCKKCLETKSLKNDFYKNGSVIYNKTCKTCWLLRGKKYRKENKETAWAYKIKCSKAEVKSTSDFVSLPFGRANELY